jgi:Zn-dependent protease with chaperone function
MRHATLRLNSPPVILTAKRLLFVALVCLLAAPHASAQGKQQTINGYAEFYKNGFLIVEGQRVAANKFTVFKKVRSLAETPLGFEVKVKGVRQPDGTFLADQLEAKPNGTAMFEPEVLANAAVAENVCVKNGMLLEQGPDGEVRSEGRIVSDGPDVDRVRNIMARLLPPYIRPDRIRVRLVENEEWQAKAMPNGAVWVYTGLLRDMSDDELAIVLGHELTHFTYEHIRRQRKQELWIGLAAAVAQGATKNPVAQYYINMGLSAWGNGYSREYEDQADRVGLRYAYEAGFNVEKGSRIWLRMLEKGGEPDKLTNLLKGDHSRPSERYALLQNEISMNYLDPPLQQTRPAAELATVGVTPAVRPAVRQAPSFATTSPASAIMMTRPIGRRPDALTALSAQPPAAVAAPRPLPPHVVRGAAGKLLPAGGYQWVNPTSPDDLRVRLMPGLVNTEDGKFRPAGGYQWVNPTDPKDFRVKLVPGLIKLGEYLRPDKGYRWINPQDPKDLRVEPIP